MTNITIKSLAVEIQTTIDRLVKQFSDAGILKSADDVVTIQEKQILLAHLNRKHHSIPEKLILQRKTRSVLNVPDISGKNKLVKIEIRKSKTFLKHDLQEANLITEEQKVQYKKDKQVYIKEKIKTEYINKEKIKLEQNNILKQDIVIINQKQQHTKDIQDISKKSAQEEKIRLEKETAELNRKVEEKIRRKFEEETYRMTEEVRRMAEEKKWVTEHLTNNKQFKKLKENYYTITDQYTFQNEDEDDCEIKTNNYRHNTRNIKVLRSIKKINKNSESKKNREETRTVIRNSKDNKRKSSIVQKKNQCPIKSINRNIIIGETITVSELANKMATKSSQVIKIMMKLGIMATINQIIDQETAHLVAEEMGHKVILHCENELEQIVMNDRDIIDITHSEPRAPVVTIMGHVDHGKTSLLDCIRLTKVAASEAGGITQHINAYHIETKKGAITFLDTPGHAAFTAMRARGTQVTDIIVLVVAADDGVMPQTIEAIQHSKTAKVPLIVAINKIDKINIEIERIKNELARNNVLSEEWGGDCQFVYVSAKTGTGIDTLLDAILLQAEVLELKAIRKGMASGAVIESFLDKNRGPVAIILVREGTLKKGDIVLCGLEYGRIRAMRNNLGHNVIEAGPSIPVEVLGLSGIPAVGDKVTVVRDERKAREVALYRQGKFREIKLSNQKKYKLENIFADTNAKKVCEINIVLKADVQGSVEAISDSLIKLSTDEVMIKIVGAGTGSITETDAMLAVVSNAILIGFNVRADTSACRIITAEKLDLRFYSIIYNLIDEMKLTIRDIFSSKIKNQTIGLAEVRNVFKLSKLSVIAGCMVIKGIIKKHHPIRILRDNIVIYEGEVESLRRFKDNINEVHSGVECGIGIKNYSNICINDIIEVLEIIKI